MTTRLSPFANLLHLAQMQIEPDASHQQDAVVQLSLRAWSPVFESIQASLDADVYRVFYGDDWRISSRSCTSTSSL